MDSANWLTAIGQAARLVVESIPDSFWLAYNWAKEWQFLLAGLFVLFAAQIFARASVRSARIRAAASVRAAEIAAGVISTHHERAGPAKAPSINAPTLRSPPTVSQAHDLAHKVDQLRSLIRSAMALLASGGDEAAGNIYCERITRLRFEENDLPANATSKMMELYKRLLLQLANVRQFNEKGRPPQELSEALFQLNARARELAAVVAPRVSGSPNEISRLASQVRG